MTPEAGHLEETLTVHKLQVPMRLRQALAISNLIESAFSVVEMSVNIIIPQMRTVSRMHFVKRLCLDRHYPSCD
jgi:hypothetical protein